MIHRLLIYAVALCLPALVSAQSAGQYSVPLANESGPATVKSWSRTASKIWGTDASGNPVNITVGGNLILNGATLEDDADAYQPLDSDLTSIAALTTTSYGRGLLTQADAAATRTTLGLGTLATQSGTIANYLLSSTAATTYQPLDSDLTSIAALTTTSYGRSLLTQADATAARTTLGLGTLATQSGTIANYLLSSTAATTYQPLDSDLTSIAALTTTTYGRSLLTQADAAAVRTLTGTVIGTDVQAYNAATTTLGNSTTGTGSIVRATSPTLITPAIGAATGAKLTVTMTDAASAGLTLQDAGGQSVAAWRYIRSDGIKMVNIGRSADSLAGTVSLFFNDGGETQLSGNNALLIAVPGNNAQFRLLPDGNDIYFQNTVSTGNIYFTGHSAGNLTGSIRFRSTGSIYFGESGAEKMIVNGSTGEVDLNGVKILAGAGSPEAAVTAPVGSLYLRTNGGAGSTLYIKESGTGNTGWQAK